MEFRAQYQIWQDGIAVMVAQTDYATGKISHLAKPVKWEMQPHAPNSYVSEPTLLLTHQEAVSLMNALWSADVRPTDFKSPNGEINRLEAHLTDMRKLVFDPPSISAGSQKK